MNEPFRTAVVSAPPEALDFRSLFEASPNPYMVLDRHLNYVTANRAYLEVVGARLEDLVGRNVFEAFPNDPDDPDNLPVRMIRESLQRVIRERRADSIALIPYRIPATGSDAGQVQHWSATHTPILRADGEVAFVLQHTVNVSELVRREGAPLDPVRVGAATQAQVEAGVMLRAHVVQESHRRLYELLNQAPVAISIYRGPRHVIELANAAMVRLVNRPVEQLLGRPLFDAIPEAAQQGFEQRLAGVRETGEPFLGLELPVRLVRETGEIEQAYVTFVYAPLRDGSGKGTADSVVVVATDVTESVRARERIDGLRAAAEEGVRLRDEFLSIASHELKTPLTAIGLRLQQLKLMTTPETANGRARQVDVIHRQVGKLGALVNGLFDVSRLANGRLELVRERVDLAALVQEVVTRHEPEAAQIGVQLDVEVERPLDVDVDRLRVEQVVTNLLSNGLRYGAGKPLGIRLSRAGDRARLVVEDQGIGIPLDALERIFRKFERAVPDRHSGGLGLGLYLTREIIDGLGGTVSVESTVGVGSRFTVELPLAA